MLETWGEQQKISKRLRQSKASSRTKQIEVPEFNMPKSDFTNIHQFSVVGDSPLWWYTAGVSDFLFFFVKQKENNRFHAITSICLG